MDDAHPEPDRLEGAPHPRDTPRLFGQDAAEAAFLAAHAGGRLHHGWLIAGPRGVGKATLAWRIARFLLTQDPAPAGLFGAPPPAATLDSDPAHPVCRRLAAGAEPRLFHLRRAWDDKAKRLKTQITVDEVRRMKSFFTLTAADGGGRVALVDDADELNPSAANALLKLLEEPPAGATILLVSHAPMGLLPTIRSRCRMLRLAPLPAPALAAALEQAGAQVSKPLALAELAGGSAGAAFRLIAEDGLELYADLVALLAGLGRLDRPQAIRLADSAAGRGAEARFDLMLTLLDLFLARLARTGVTGTPPAPAAPDEAAVLTRLAPDPGAGRAWADLAATLGARARRGRAVNLDPAALMLDMLVTMDQTAGTLAQR